MHIAAKIYNPSFANVTNMGVVRFDMSFAPKRAVGEATVGHQELGYLLTDGTLFWIFLCWGCMLVVLFEGFLRAVCA